MPSPRDRLLALNYQDCCLYLSDVDLLKGPHWLNDQIISFYFEYLEKDVWAEHSDRFLFVSPEVTQCIKFAPDDVELFLEPLRAHDKDFLFFALNDNLQVERAGGSHWSLLVYSRPENCFFHYDSSYGTNANHANLLENILIRALHVPNARAKEASCLQQSNSYDCGIHVLCTVDLLSHMAIRHDEIDGSGNVAYEAIKCKRNDLLNIILDLGGRID